MTLEEAQAKARACFTQLEPPRRCALVEVGRREGEGLGFAEQLQAMTPPGFPLPGLLLFGFARLLGLKPYGPEEKMRWGVAFGFHGKTFCFELRKLGLRMLCEPELQDAPLVKEVLGRSRALTAVAEEYLASTFASEQIAAGRFTIQNLYHPLDARYRFLREEAQAAYAKPPPEPTTGGNDFATCTTFDPGRPEREGSALGTAAVDAYFSRQEHVFCLAAAFNPPRANLPILDFLAASWRTKARSILDVNDHSVKPLYDKLVAIREEWRNPLAHGGFLSGRGSLHFHVPRVGALPAQLRRTPTGLIVGFSLQIRSFTEIMDIFDSFDENLSEGQLRYAMKWIAAGLDVAFDPHSTTMYSSAMNSDEEFDSFVQAMSSEADRHANMDY